ncbi:helix-turn-helix domain-containing protein [Synechococcales cyanobacterium C]|uniref:Helix-turn-helix domain-containing protein n=1 Tax=Petrachloros mirabilis ULC683 TaxID=2781853 RepID=A0A8K2A9G9_9CYAN|nr:AraC family transcriptional regulator [Petrachloros mirabilis]NCJ08259.1 helix-turn-helix domain-containing protein [Petrachloros mirabilis ULC683]
MSLDLTAQEVDEVWTEALSHPASQESPEESGEFVQTDPFDPLDVSWLHPSETGQGTTRSLQLREGLDLKIFDAPLSYESSAAEPETLCDAVEFHFHIQGHHEDGLTQVGDREFCIYGSGLHPQHCLYSPEQQSLEVWLHVQTEALRSILADESGELPREVVHWVRSAEEQRYARVGKMTPPLERVLWEVVRCPCQGRLKRLFLEGKVLELLSLMMGWEQAIQGRRAVEVPARTRERVHFARELLLQNLHKPLTLAELAQRSQLSESALKRGFKQEFGMTAFDYLLNYRLEQAREMLERGTMQVAEVMTAVGLKNRSYFAAAFRQKFGQNPKQYQQQFWQ